MCPGFHKRGPSMPLSRCSPDSVLPKNGHSLHEFLSFHIPQDPSRLTFIHYFTYIKDTNTFFMSSLSCVHPPDTSAQALMPGLPAHITLFSHSSAHLCLLPLGLHSSMGLLCSASHHLLFPLELFSFPRPWNITENSQLPPGHISDLGVATMWDTFHLSKTFVLVKKAEWRCWHQGSSSPVSFADLPLTQHSPGL